MCGNSFKDGASHPKKMGVLLTITGNLLEGGEGQKESRVSNLAQ